MMRTILLAVALALATICVATTSALAMRDPGGPAGPYADGMSLYEYCSSGPAKGNDPLGLARQIGDDPVFGKMLGAFVDSVDYLGGGGLASVWSTENFVYHYYTGRGRAIDLADVGLLETFKNAPDVRRSVEDFKGRVDTRVEVFAPFTCCTRISLQPPETENLSGKITDKTDVTSVIYSVGRSTFFREYDCDVNCAKLRASGELEYHCRLAFSIKDSFKEPLDLKGVEVGGTPYPINASWTEEYP